MASLAPFTGSLDKKKAAHILHRTTFGPNRPQIDRFTGYTAVQALNEIYQVTEVPLPPTEFPQYGEDIDQGALVDKFRNWSLELMRTGGPLGTSGIEKLVFFLHTHFPTRISIVEKHLPLYNQNVILRKYALGNIKELAKIISIDNAMLILLDGRINVKGNPNENYARELLELYTIGKGLQIGPTDYTTYTEDDIKAAARVLSGWKNESDLGPYANIDPLNNVAVGVFDLDRHDSKEKVFSKAFGGKTITTKSGSTDFDIGYAELTELIEMIFAQQATAKNICRKIYRFFLYYIITEEVERDIITPMADTLIANNYELKPVLLQFLQSQHFFDEDTLERIDDNNRSAIIKSPLEVVFNTLRFFNIAVPDPYKTEILDCLYEQGLDLFEPLDVAGYSAYHQEPHFHRNWISSNNLARRYQFGALIISGKRGETDLGCKLDIVAFIKDPKNISDPTTDATVVDELLAYLLPEQITEVRRNFFFNIFTQGLPSTNWPMEWNKYINTQNDIEVRKPLEALVNAILQSPEYQLS